MAVPRAKRWKRWVGYYLALGGVSWAFVEFSGVRLDRSLAEAIASFLVVGTAAAWLGWGIYWIRGNRKAEETLYVLKPQCPPMRTRAIGLATVLLITAVVAGCRAPTSEAEMLCGKRAHRALGTLQADGVWRTSDHSGWTLEYRQCLRDLGFSPAGRWPG